MEDIHKKKLEEETEKAKEVYKTASDVESLKTATENLTKDSNEIFTKLYQNANPQGATDGSTDGQAGGTDPNNFSDFTTK